MKNKIRWTIVSLVLIITTFLRINLTLLYSPINSEILAQYFSPTMLNVIFSIVTLIIIFTSVLGTYIFLVIFNNIVSHDMIDLSKAKTAIYKIYIVGFSLYNIFYINYLLIRNEIMEGIQLNIFSIIFFFLISVGLYKFLSVFKKSTHRWLFSLLIFFVNSFFAFISLIFA